MKVSFVPRWAEPRKVVEDQYERLARILDDSGSSSVGPCSFLSSYHDQLLKEIPESIIRSSLGCGDPVIPARAQPGERVLDLGCGAGLDCLLTSRAVAVEGRVVGIDMTNAMLELAKRSVVELGCPNVFLCRALMEELPIRANTMDLVISNSSINLSPTKENVFKEMFRVLRPGGRFSVCDMVLDGAFPDDVKNRVFAWAGCLNGALTQEEYLVTIINAGFENVVVESRISFGLDQITNLDETSQHFLSDVFDWSKLSSSAGLFSIRITGRRSEVPLTS